MKITNTEVYGLDNALKVSGYPMRTEFESEEDYESAFKRGKKLGNAKSGSGHNNYLKGILVNFDMEYTIYWTPQLQRYSFINFISSSSSMHKGKLGIKYNEYVDDIIKNRCDEIIKEYNENQTKINFMRMVSNYPQGQLKFAGMTSNYLQFQTVYRQRAKFHKLEDWHIFCAWCETLPKFVELCLGGERYYTEVSDITGEIFFRNDRIYYEGENNDK